MKGFLVYLDNSVLNRPFDDQSVPSVKLETIALIFILDLIERKKLKLVNSAVIEFENSKNPFEYKRLWIESVINKAMVFQNLNNPIIRRAETIRKDTINPIDALHIASAEERKVDFFITCDHDVIRKYKGKTKILNPIDLIKILEL